jgi:hypothetical protein
MSEDAKRYRAEMKSKAEKRGSAGDPREKVDASDWTPPEDMNTEAKTGLRPISPRAYKRGGKVHGEPAKHHAGKKPRASGGSANDFIDRDVKEANAKLGKPHIGGYAKGGHVSGCKCKECMGGKVMKAAGGGINYTGGTRPTGGREARASGGKTGKGKTNINIIIAGKGDSDPSMGQVPPMPPRPPTPVPMASPAGSPVPGGMPPGAPPQMPPPMMGRKSGGRAYPVDAGAGGARGRLEKIKSYGLKP